MKHFILLFLTFLLFETANGLNQASADTEKADAARIILKVTQGQNGHQMLLDADANTYSSINHAVPVFVLSYRLFEYKIPVNADGNPATKNTIINGSQNIDIPAGTYDYFITQPVPSLNRIECSIGSRSGTRGHNFVFEAGNAYRFTVSSETVVYDIRSANAPAEPSDFTIISNTSGVTKCTLNWTNPGTTNKDEPLITLNKITILRDERIVAVIANPVPNARSEWTDTNPLNGNHTYSIYADNGAGQGFPVSQSIELTNIVLSPVANKDAAIIAATTPVSGCGLTNAEPVTVTIQNKGTQSISNIPVYFDVNGQPTGSGTCTASIPAGEKISFLFDQKADLSSARTSYAIRAYTALDGDENPDNNAFTEQIDNYGDCSFTVPYLFGFEDDMDMNCWKIYNFGEESDSWRRISKATSAEPVYSEQHGMVRSWKEGKSWLISPRISIPASGVTQLSFWSQYYILGGYGKSSVWITDNLDANPETASYTELWSPTSLSANMIDKWIETVIDLSSYKNKDVHVAFCYEGKTGGYAHRWALDDISIVRLPDRDAGITTVQAPQNGTNLTGTEQVTVTVRNYSSQTLNIPVHYQINNGVIISETIASLGSQKDTVYTFSQEADLSVPGVYNFLVYTGLSNDENPNNDTKKISVSNYGNYKISSFPYSYGFENIDDLHYWTVLYPGPVNIPSIEGSDIAEPHGGNAFWRFMSFYGNGGEEKNYEQYLITPEIVTGEPKILEFYYRPSDFWTYEKFKVGYSTTDNKISSFTWISDTETIRKSWEKYTNILPADAKYIAIFFYSHPFFLYIDDITIDLLPESRDIGVTQILSPLHGNPEPEPVSVILKNFGGTPVTSVSVSYQLLNYPPVTEVYQETIEPAMSVEFTFKEKVYLSEYRDDYQIKVYTSLEGDLDHSNDTAFVQFVYRPNVQLYGYRLIDDLIHTVEVRSPVTFFSNDPSQVNIFNDYQDELNFPTACEYFNDTIYCYTTSTNGMDRFFIQLTGNWEQISKVSAKYNALDMAYDYTTHTLFATLGTNLAKVNRQTGDMTMVASTRYFWTLACDLNGQLFGIDRDGWFCKIDKKLGVATPIKQMDVKPNYIQSMSFDHQTERLFWTMSAEGRREDGRPMDLGRLYEINPETGEAVNLGSINGAGEAEIVGLYTPYIYSEVSIISPETKKSVSIFPNPSDGQIHITSVPEKTVIRIFDLSGKTLESYTSLSGTITLNLHLPKGVYFIHFEGEKEKMIQKLIIK
jgi:hypothetical protein